jgi:hypothetical protein
MPVWASVKYEKSLTTSKTRFGKVWQPSCTKKTMKDTKVTVAELISELKSTTEDFEWRFVGSTKLLRGFLKSGETLMPFDPIRALSFIKLRQIFEDTSCLEAGAAIGISPSDCSDIIDASKNSLQEDTNQSIPDPYKTWLRRQLIFAVKLDFPSNPNAIWTSIPAKSPSLG